MLLRLISGNIRPHVLANSFKSCRCYDASEFNQLFNYTAIRTLTKNYHRDDKPKSPKNRNENRLKEEKPKIESLYLKQNDADVFGTLSIEKPYIRENKRALDEGDAAEEKYLKDIPLRKHKLSTTQYANLIKAEIKKKRIKEAIDVLELKMIKEDQVKPCNYIYNLLIGECGRLGYAQKAFQLYTRMKQRALKVTGGTYTALFNACANSPFKGDGLEKANNLRKIILQNGYEPNESNYNAMIKAYGRCGDIQTAFLLVDEMKERNLQMKVDTFNFLLQACISDKEYGFRHALLVWHKIYKKSLTPDIFSFNLMLKCARDCEMGDVNTTRQVIATILSESQNKEKNLKLKTINGNILQIESQKPIENVNELVNSTDEKVIPAEQSVIHDQTPNLLSKAPHLGTLVSLKEVKKPEDRLLLLGGISGFLNEMNIANIIPDIKTFTNLLDVIPSTKVAENKLIAAVRDAEVRTDIDFFNILMKKRSMRCDYEAAKDVLLMIEAARLEPDIVTYGVLSLGCKTREEIQDFLQQMYDKGIKVNIPILGAMLKNACMAKEYDSVLEILHIIKVERLMPSAKIMEIISTFNLIRFRSIGNKTSVSQHDRNEYFRFYREYQNWIKDMGLEGVIDNNKSVEEHPWKQYKESQPDGVEPAKNTRKQLLRKKKHLLSKLTDVRLANDGRPTPMPQPKKKNSLHDTQVTQESKE